MPRQIILERGVSVLNFELKIGSKRSINARKHLNVLTGSDGNPIPPC
jgi:hypothetical protein